MHGDCHKEKRMSRKLLKASQLGSQYFMNAHLLYARVARPVKKISTLQSAPGSITIIVMNKLRCLMQSRSAGLCM